jgi:hypothetical protein
MKRPARVPSQLSKSLHKRLSAYTLAAGAAGVGVLALAQPAEARIVYTRALLHVDYNHGVLLDLTNDGTNNFSFSARFDGSVSSSIGEVNVRPLGPGNAVALTEHREEYSSAGALHLGAKIDAARRWNPHYYDAVLVGGWRPSGGDIGKFHPPHQHYLGLRFKIHGKTHYGWARFSGIRFRRRKETGLKVWGDVTGYAYETIPNKPIIAGKTHGGNEPTLGRLAQGASGLSNGGKP